MENKLEKTDKMLKEFIKTQYMSDCIHLHSCRRICKYWNISNRQCNKTCKAYQKYYITHRQINKLVDKVFEDFPNVFLDNSGYEVYLGEAVDYLKQEIKNLFEEQQ